MSLITIDSFLYIRFKLLSQKFFLWLCLWTTAGKIPKILTKKKNVHYASNNFLPLERERKKRVI